MIFPYSAAVLVTEFCSRRSSSDPPDDIGDIETLRVSDREKSSSCAGGDRISRIAWSHALCRGRNRSNYERNSRQAQGQLVLLEPSPS